MVQTVTNKNYNFLLIYLSGFFPFILSFFFSFGYEFRDRASLLGVWKKQLYNDA